jgi:hypothetical protein
LFQKELKKNDVNFKFFSRYKDFPNIDGKIVFYLFNAQSNCRIVTNRNAKHIFVTHGESNKAASVKPIIRIYDYVIVAGQMGIDRYLHNNIFYEADVKRKRIIKMGNTFIGDPKYQYDKNSNKILYAPTWEGGVIEENYSSLNQNNDSFVLLDKYMSENKIEHIVIQPHPNTGHRDGKYIAYLVKGIEYLLKKKYKIILKDFKFNFYNNIKFNLINKISFSINDNITHSINKAFVDVSAMEVQLISQNIPTYVFFINTSINKMPINNIAECHYKLSSINNYIYNKEIMFDYDFKHYSISYETNSLKSTPLNKRLDWLQKYIHEN